MKTIIDSMRRSRDVLEWLLDCVFPRPKHIQEMMGMTPAGFESRIRGGSELVPIFIQTALGECLPVYSLGSYRNNFVKEAIHEVKYNKNVRLAKRLGTMIERAVQSIASEIIKKQKIGHQHNVKNIIVVPIPSHPTKLKMKGFNQTELILRFVTRANEINVDVVHALQKTRQTADQTHLTRQERLSNVQHCFEIRPGFEEQLNDRDVIIFDDVVTTGGTLLEAHRVLCATGVRSVVGCTVAH